MRKLIHVLPLLFLAACADADFTLGAAADEPSLKGDATSTTKYGAVEDGHGTGTASAPDADAGAGSGDAVDSGTAPAADTGGGAVVDAAVVDTGTDVDNGGTMDTGMLIVDTGTVDTGTVPTEDDASSICTELRTYRAGACSWLDILGAINVARATARNCGASNAKPAVGPLTWNEPLAAASLQYVNSVAGANVAPGSLMPTAPDGSTSLSRVTSAGYGGGAVNQGYGTATEGTTPTAFVNGLLANTSTCESIMDGTYKHFGFGAKKGATYLYASWYFGRP